MANMFSVEPANPMQALMAGVSGFDRGAKYAKDAEISAGRQEAMQALQSGGDTRSALARLIGIGDVQGAKAISDYAESQANRSFRETEAQRAQRNADRSFGLQQQQFGLQQQQANRPEIVMVQDPNNPEVKIPMVRDRMGATLTPAATPGLQPAQQPSNPYAPAGKQTEGQANASLYARRLFQAERVLRDPKVESAATSVTEQIGGAVGNRLPFGIGRGAMSESFQKYDQAKRDFVNAVLRRESGAVISDAEFANAEKQYFPAPGDTPAVLKQKRQNREEAIRGIAGAAGRSYTPEFVFGGQGGIVPNPRSAQQPQQTQVPQQPMNDRPEISQAREAIARGADPRAVMQRMQDRGIQFDPRELELQ